MPTLRRGAALGKVILILEEQCSDEDIKDYSTPELLHAMLEWTDQLRPKK